MQKIRVVDVPERASAEVAEEILNVPCEEGYYLDRLVGSPVPEMTIRAYYRLRAKPEKG